MSSTTLNARELAEMKAVTATVPLLVFPWSFVVGDNHRLQPARNRKGMVMTRHYRQAKREMATLAALQWGPSPKLAGDVRLVAACWFPDRRRRDAGNYRKAITDSLTGVCYGDDAQITDERWLRSGYDKQNARIEIRLEAAA